MGVIIILFVLCLAIFVRTSILSDAAIPQDWAEGIGSYDILYNREPTEPHLLPVLGNGVISWQIDSPFILVNGLYTRRGNDSARVCLARLPSLLSVHIRPSFGAVEVSLNPVIRNDSLPILSILSKTTSNFVGEALDLRSGSFMRRLRFFRSASEDVVRTEAVVDVEQRWYAHRSIHSLLVLEVQATTRTPTALSAEPMELHMELNTGVGDSTEEETGEAEEPGEGKEEGGSRRAIHGIRGRSHSKQGAEADVVFRNLSAEYPGLSVYTGVLHAPENASAAPPSIALVSTPLPRSLLITNNETWYFLSAVRTSLGARGRDGGREGGGADRLLQETLLDHRLAQGMAASGELYELHKDDWKQWWRQVGIEMETRGGREEGQKGGWEGGREGGTGGSGVIPLPAAVNASLYALGSTARDDRPWGVPRGGRGEGGAEEGTEEGDASQHVGWDMEVYIFPALLLFNPAWARALLQYRFQRLEIATTSAMAVGEGDGKEGERRIGAMREEGADRGYEKGGGRRGAMREEEGGGVAALFPWESAGTGEEVSRKEGRGRRVHASGAVAGAMWQYWLATQDEDWMEEVGCPVLRGVANLWVMRAEETEEEGKGRAHLRGVYTPDEAAGLVDDSASVSGMAWLSLGWAGGAKGIVRRRRKRKEGEKAMRPTRMDGKEEEVWARLRERLVIPFHEARCLHPEYEAYADAPVGNADVVLLGYPLGYFASPSLPPSSPPSPPPFLPESVDGAVIATSHCSSRSSPPSLPSSTPPSPISDPEAIDVSRSRHARASDFSFYWDRFQEGKGSREGRREGGLTWGVEVVTGMDLGEGGKAQEAFFRSYGGYCRPPFGVWMVEEGEGEDKESLGAKVEEGRARETHGKGSVWGDGEEGGTGGGGRKERIFYPAAGAFLQACLQGYGGLRLMEEGGKEEGREGEREGGREKDRGGRSVLRLAPHCPQGVRRVVYRHLHFMGHHFRVEYECEQAGAEGEEAAEDQREEARKEGKMSLALLFVAPGAPPLAFVRLREDGKREELPIVVGETVRVERQEAWIGRSEEGEG